MTKAIVVTGASTGIGRATAEMAATQGYLVFGTVRNAGSARDLRSRGIYPLTMDVTDDASVGRAYAECVANLDGAQLAALVNNAGVQSVGPVELVPAAEVMHVLNVNVVGAVRTSQAFLPALREHRGRIVNVSSVSGRTAFPFMGPYAASKFALEGLSDSMRRELSPHGVRVILVEPGSIKTPIWDKVAGLDVDRFRVAPYDAYIDGLRRSAARSADRALPAEQVAVAILNAVVAPNPAARMAVVRSKWRSHLPRWLPTSWVDRMVSRGLESMRR